MKKSRILIVEDSPTQRAALRIILTEHDFEVECAADAESGYELVKSSLFDLILTDIVMPGLCGYDLCRKIKANPETATLPVILLTTLSGPIDILQGLECGADNFITKPYHPDDLIERVTSILTNRAMRASSSSLVGVDVSVMGKTVTITSGREQLLDLLISTFQELLHKNTALEDANRAKDRFLASMSHELRTPLNAILGFTGTLLMKLPGPLTVDQEKQLRTVQASGRHLLSLINDLLDLAKIESGRVELHLEPVECASVVEEVSTALRPSAAAKGLVFEIKVDPPALAVRADRRALSQILLNLTSNAIKFTEQGRVSIQVGNRQEADKRLIAFSVSDTGIGIRVDDQAKLFQAFTQVDASRRQRTEGTGLGLHLSRKLAELLGGQLTLHSEFGKGSTFTLLLAEA